MHMRKKWLGVFCHNMHFYFRKYLITLRKIQYAICWMTPVLHMFICIYDKQLHRKETRKEIRLNGSFLGSEIMGDFFLLYTFFYISGN